MIPERTIRPVTIHGPTETAPGTPSPVIAQDTLSIPPAAPAEYGHELAPLTASTRPHSKLELLPEGPISTVADFLQARETVAPSQTSQTMHAAFAPEILRRRKEELIARWERDCMKQVAKAQHAFASPWTRKSLDVMPGILMSLGMCAQAEAFVSQLRAHPVGSRLPTTGQLLKILILAGKHQEALDMFKNLSFIDRDMYGFLAVIAKLQTGDPRGAEALSRSQSGLSGQAVLAMSLIALGEKDRGRALLMKLDQISAVHGTELEGEIVAAAWAYLGDSARALNRIDNKLDDRFEDEALRLLAPRWIAATSVQADADWQAAFRRVSEHASRITCRMPTSNEISATIEAFVPGTRGRGVVFRD
ncbi:hypothetical protein [Caenimonas sp. SL110]|uniref:hypothetical protein n=1 Tax=Caenimonas sp. SL110 TaxID=1450524 RepID=UPI0006532E3B|nr:hypothetical protein [Caenimonas sp. SL110]